jgi:hypothetical protein
MRVLQIVLAIGLLYLGTADATPIPGGPCVIGTVQQYADLGLAGCTATVGSTTLQVVLGEVVTGTNAPGGDVPDASAFLIQPNFLALPTGFRQDFNVSLVPDRWHPLPGQELLYRIGFNETLAPPLTTIQHIVSTSVAGQLESEICLGPLGYVFFACSGNAYTTTSSGTSTTVAVTLQSPTTRFAVLGSFVGTLPDGNLALSLSTAVAVVPEPSAFVLMSLGMIGVGLVRRSPLRSRHLNAP